MMIKVELVYLCDSVQYQQSLSVAQGSTIHQVLNQSDLLEECPNLDIRQLMVGVFGQRKKLSDVVLSGDRIEIYRELICDPKKQRRKRVS